MSKTKKMKIKWSGKDEKRYQLLKNAERYISIDDKMIKTPEYLEFLELNRRRLAHNIEKMERG